MTNSPNRSNSRNQTLSPQRSSSRSSTVSPKRRSSLPRPTPKKIPSEIVASLKQNEAEYEEEGIVGTSNIDLSINIVFHPFVKWH